MWSVIALAFSGLVNIFVAFMLWQTHKRLEEVSERYKTAVIRYQALGRRVDWLTLRLYRVTRSHTHVGKFSEFTTALREEYDNDVNRRPDRSR